MGLTAGYFRNGQPFDGVSFQTKYSITRAAAEKLKVVEIFEADGSESVKAFYDSADAIDLTDYKGFPKYTLILDLQSYKDHMKVAKEGTSTWKSSAARS